MLSSIASLFRGADSTLYCPAALLEQDLATRCFLITGGTSGFGKTVATQLVSQGAHVILGVRRLEAGEAVATDLTAAGPGTCVARRLDLASFASIRTFAQEIDAEYSRLDVLIENAAVCCVPNVPTAENLEPHLGVNHYGHFLLRQLLAPKLAASRPSRVVVVGSSLHDRMFDLKPTELDLESDPAYLGFTTEPNVGKMEGWKAYARSKLANVMSAKAQAPGLAEQGVVCVSLHPGLDTSTELFRSQRIAAWVMGWLMPQTFGVQSTWQSVQTILYCALEEHSKLEPGAYYSQFYKSGYRDGSNGGWPLKSPNPLVNADDCAKLLKTSHAVVAAPSKADLPAVVSTAEGA